METDTALANQHVERPSQKQVNVLHQRIHAHETNISMLTVDVLFGSSAISCLNNDRKFPAM
jgi:hypothetical protein